MSGTRGAGVPRAGAGKILPRPRRTVGGEKAGRPEPYTGVRGASPGMTVLQVLIALVLAISCIGAYAPPVSWGFILSPSATLRVAGQVC